MSDRLLDKYTGRENANGSNAAVDDDTEIEDLGGVFGFLRGSRERAVMLELRKRNGNITAIPYAYIERAEFDPSEGITLHLARGQVRIRGRNLNTEARPRVKLFEAIARNRVPWIQEASTRDETNLAAAVILIRTIDV